MIPSMRTINWSDRECVIDDDPEQIAAAVVACAVDHSYDRGQTGVPWGLSDEERELCKPIVAKHLGAIDPEWRERTVYLTEVQKLAFRREVAAALTAGRSRA